ncbi:c-type cytochrome [Nitrosomonas communis]|uniref:c-type cytochrome n=1 Tax=Nitrosomonas communis TaxID=44574 RepID=UPI0026EEF428|nr:c-type cytochrome [Nitrosomonas communis]MCO6428933.1 c-type cytochrome [Nitrosomonas communis]
MKSFIIVSLITVVLVLIALGSGAYNMAATEKHWAITEQMISWVRESSIKARAEELEVPALDNADIIAKGFKQYHAMCTECHLAPGKQPTELAIGLYPQAPLFYERAPVTDADDKLYLSKKYFWVIKNGIKMTAMPAWGSTHSDEAMWATVAFLHKLHGMTAEQYAAFGGEPHREDDHTHDHHH